MLLWAAEPESSSLIHAVHGLLFVWWEHVSCVHTDCVCMFNKALSTKCVCRLCVCILIGCVCYISDALFKNSLMEGCLNLAQQLNAHDSLKTEKGRGDVTAKVILDDECLLSWYIRNHTYCIFIYIALMII